LPTYTIHNKDKDEFFDTICTWGELQLFLENNPQCRKIITAPNIVAGNMTQKDGGFKETKTYNAITKHAKSIGKSHDLNAISQEYKQGQLVK